MAGPGPPLRFTEQVDEIIARRDRIGIRTGMPGTAAAVHFARSHAREANMRTFRAPDRPIAIPDRDGRAGEGLSGRNDRGEQKQADHHRFRNAHDRSIQTSTPSKIIQGQREAPKQERALGEAAAGRRARGPVGQPPSGKDTGPSAQRGPEQRAAPGAACRRQCTPLQPRPIWSAADMRISALVTNDVPRLAAKAARPLGPFKTSDTGSCACRNAGLGNRGQVEPIDDAFVAEQRAFHAADKSLNPFGDG